MHWLRYSISTDLSVGECLTQSPFLQKLKDDPSIPRVRWSMPKYASVPYALIEQSTVGNYRLLVSTWVCFAVLFWILLSLFCACVASPLLGLCHCCLNHPSRVCKVTTIRQLLSVGHPRYEHFLLCSLWSGEAISQVWRWHPLSWGSV